MSWEDFIETLDTMRKGKVENQFISRGGKFLFLSSDNEGLKLFDHAAEPGE